jgi:hypothetical protein
MRTDNVVANEALALADFGVAQTALRTILAEYRLRAAGPSVAPVAPSRFRPSQVRWPRVTVCTLGSGAPRRPASPRLTDPAAGCPYKNPLSDMFHHLTVGGEVVFIVDSRPVATRAQLTGN